jgi:hypothetical protein
MWRWLPYQGYVDIKMKSQRSMQVSKVDLESAIQDVIEEDIQPYLRTRKTARASQLNTAKVLLLIDLPKDILHS